MSHEVSIRKSGRFRSRRLGRFPRTWAARCSCGWRGVGGKGHPGWLGARADVLRHLDETRDD